MRIRTIKPEFWCNEALSELPAETHMLAAALLNYADDEGYFNANEKLIKAACFPLRDLSVTIHGSITDLSNVGFLTLHSATDGRTYGHITQFTTHQVINRPKPSKIKALLGVTDQSVIDHGSISDASRLEGNGKERNREKLGAARQGASPTETTEAKVYRIGKEVLGAKSGGVITKLVSAKGRDFAAALKVLESSRSKHDPVAYIHGAIKQTTKREQQQDAAIAATYAEMGYKIDG